jgi:hypothetical protein
MYIWRRTPRRQPWDTALGVAPTVGCTARWGQVPAAVGHGDRNPSAVARVARNPCRGTRRQRPGAVGHGVSATTI